MEPAMQCCRTRGAAGARQHEARSRGTEGFLRLVPRTCVKDPTPSHSSTSKLGSEDAIWSQRGPRLGTRRFTEVHGATVNILHRPDSLPSREDCQLPAQLADLLPSPTKKPPTLQTRPLLRVIRDISPPCPDSHVRSRRSVPQPFQCLSFILLHQPSPWSPIRKSACRCAQQRGSCPGVMGAHRELVVEIELMTCSSS